MKKILKQYGEGLIIYFTKEEVKIYNLKKGITMDVTDPKMREIK